MKKRMVHIDLLRILACFSVLMLHSAAVFWYDRPVTGGVWLTANFYDALSRYGVPIFVMISGALFLQEQRMIDWKKLYMHNIARLVTAYIAWSCFYGLLICRQNGGIRAVGWKTALQAMLHGHYHLWFLPMLAGLYMLVPVLRSWIHGAQKKNIQYFLALWFGLQILRSTLLALAEGHIEWEYLLNIPQIEMACGYVGYFVLGYYLMNIGIEAKFHRWIYVGGIAGAIANAVLSTILSVKAGEPRAAVFDSFSLSTFAMTAALFLFFTKVVGKITISGSWERVIREIADCTLGIYVLHISLLEAVQAHVQARFDTAAGVAIAIPVSAVSCFVVCGVVTGVIRRIPLLEKIV